MSSSISAIQIQHQKKNKLIDEQNLRIVENRNSFKSMEFFKDFIEPYVPPTIIVIENQPDYLDLSNIELAHLDFIIDGTKIYIDEVVITLSKYPLCLQTGDLHSHCETCDFFSKSDCIFQTSDDFFFTILFFYQSAWRKASVFTSKKLKIIDALHKQLSLINGPVHYQDLTNQVRKKFPFLKVKPRSAYRLMHENPDRFFRYRPGWYIAI
jgi:hypothetical protein